MVLWQCGVEKADEGQAEERGPSHVLQMLSPSSDSSSKRRFCEEDLQHATELDTFNSLYEG